MSNTARNNIDRGDLLKQAVAALLLLGGGRAMAANVPVDLCATPGSIPATATSGLAGQAILGYTLGAACPSNATAPVGPTIYAHVGDTVSVTLYNGLGEPTGLLFQGQALVPDTTGVPAAGSKTYTFVAGSPGTYLYEAAPLANAEHQSAMGLHGALVVRPVATTVSASGTASADDGTGTVLTDAAASFPATLQGGTLSIAGGACTITAVTPTTLTCGTPIAAGWLAGDAYSATSSVEAGSAYTDAGADSAFTSEAVLVLSELDPALNAAGAAFDMRTYAPKYFLINGQAYPDTAPITSAAGGKVLLRYLNAGAQHHSMSLLGLRQRFVGRDGNVLPTSGVALTAETIGPGQTADAIATLPATLAVASHFAVYDASLQLHNNGAAGFGGMLTFVDAGAGTAVTGPVASAVALSSPTSNGSADVTLSATLTASGGGTVAGAEYFVDATGTGGLGCAMTGSAAASALLPAAAGAVAPCVDLATLASGKHTFYVHGTDGTNWGAFGSATLNLDKTGPTASALVLNPNPTTGSVAVALTATADDTASGGSNVATAEYRIDNGTPVPMTLNTTAAPVSALSASIPAVGTALSSHLVEVRATDELGNVGTWVPVTLTVSAAGPTTSAVTVAPNPNNGAKPLTSGQPVVRVRATMGSTVSTIVAAEGFIDNGAAPVTTRGFPLVPTDGLWNAASEAGYADIPLTTIAALSTGDHLFYVRGRDAVGNWGSVAFGTLTIDKTAPVVTPNSVTLALATPLNPSSPVPATAATNNAPVTVIAAATDAACTNNACAIAGGEYFIDTLGAVGTGRPMTAGPAAGQITATIPANVLQGLNAGLHNVIVRAVDAAGNYSTTSAAGALRIDRTLPLFDGATLTTTAGGQQLGLVNPRDVNAQGGQSGLAQGQYVINATNFPNNGGNLFAVPGTVSSPLPTIPTNSFVNNCSNQVNVRIRDAATNWSNGNGGFGGGGAVAGGVRTVLFTRGTVNDQIFANGFDTGASPWGWSSRSTNSNTRLNVTAGAAQAGGSKLQAQGNNANYVQYNFNLGPNGCVNTTPTVDARFYFNPNGNTGNNQDILVGRSAAGGGGGGGGGADVYTVQFRRQGAASQVRIQLGNANSGWTNIANNAFTRIEVTWQAAANGNPGRLALYVGGATAPNATLTSNTNTTQIGSIRLGSVASGGNATLEYFDSVVVKRSVATLIGP